VVKRIHGRGPISLFNFITLPYRVSGAPWPPGGTKDEGRATTKTTMGVDRSEDQNELGDYIDRLSVVKGQTQLFDAIRSMADELNVNVDSDEDSYKDKIIILITDGDQQTQLDGAFVSYPNETNIRKKQVEQLIKDLKQSGIKVYAVGLLGELDAYGGFSEKTQKERAEYFLKKITKETGGKAVVSMSGKININKALDELFAK
ncbi:MAG TPA: vWA domain-containing protein, partial [Pyrinomonadaceae bacterium]